MIHVNKRIVVLPLTSILWNVCCNWVRCVERVLIRQATSDVKKKNIIRVVFIGDNDSQKGLQCNQLFIFRSSALFFAKLFPMYTERRIGTGRALIRPASSVLRRGNEQYVEDFAEHLAVL